MSTFLTRSAAIVAVCASVTLGGLPFAAPATAVPATTPCAAGVPVPGDFDGDGGADLLAAAIDGNDPRYQVVPSDDGAPVWLAGHFDMLRRADLNGDVCADAVTVIDRAPTLFFGTPDGLDMASPVTLTVPHQVGLPSDEKLDIQAAGLRHDGISQVVVSGVILYEGWFDNPFIDVITLDRSGAAASSQSIELKPLGVTTDEGFALAADGGQVALGAQDDTVGKAAKAGAVYLFSADTADSTKLVFRTRLTQDSPRVPDKAEAGDNFGASVALRDGHLAIGAERERIGSARMAGLVQPILWTGSGGTYTVYRAIQQATRGVVGTNETGDHFGDHVAIARGLTGTGSYDIAIAASGENVGKAVDAGSLTIANFTRAIFRTYTQNSKGVPGTAKTYDGLGSAVGTLQTSPTTDTLLVGAIGEDAPGCHNLGYVVRTDGRKLSSATKWTTVPAPGCSSTRRFWGIAFGD